MIALILLLPVFIAYILTAVLPNGPRIKYFAIIGTLASLVLLPFIGYGNYSARWFAVGGYGFDLSVSVAPLNYMLLAIILIIAPFVFLYSFGYISARNEQKRFYLEMLGFELSMLAFAMSGGLLLLFISWEFLSFTSYLLIGFWYGRAAPPRAARKAFTIVLMGDLALLGAIVILWNIFGSLSFSTIALAATPIGQAYSYFVAAAVLLIIAIFTKSAQFPFHEWLPDAMEGPTPVSAFLHSSTMVKAGVFASILLLPVFIATHTTSILFYGSAITVALSTFNAMKETHIKKVIAYSTIQELGLMIFAISGGAVLAGIYFFLAQSFYKALLFFSSGLIMDASETEDITKAYGLSYNKLIYFSTAFGVLSLAGFLPFDGFFSSASISSSFSSNLVVYVAVTATSLLTSFYIFRWFLLGSRPTKNERIKVSYAHQPRSMVYSVVAMAPLPLAASIVFFYLKGFLVSSTPYYLYGYLASSAIHILPADAILETAVILAGAAISFEAIRRNASLRNRPLYYLVYSRIVFDAAYTHFARFVYDISEGVALFDLYVSDAFDSVGKAVLRSGYALRRLSSGSINLYALALSIGILLIIAYAYLTGIPGV